MFKITTMGVRLTAQNHEVLTTEREPAGQAQRSKFIKSIQIKQNNFFLSM